MENGNPSVIAMACGVLWRLFFNGLMPPNKYKTIRMRRCHLKLAANFSLCVSYFFLHTPRHTPAHTRGQNALKPTSMTPDQVSISSPNSIYHLPLTIFQFHFHCHFHFHLPGTCSSAYLAEPQL